MQLQQYYIEVIPDLTSALLQIWHHVTILFCYLGICLKFSDENQMNVQVKPKNVIRKLTFKKIWLKEMKKK